MYRATGADLPFGDPLRAHGVAMEGYFLRITDSEHGRVVIALIGVNRGPRGQWATLGLASDEVTTPPGAGGSRRVGDGQAVSSSSTFSSLRLAAAPHGWALSRLDGALRAGSWILDAGVAQQGVDRLRVGVPVLRIGVEVAEDHERGARVQAAALPGVSGATTPPASSPTVRPASRSERSTLARRS